MVTQWLAYIDTFEVDSISNDYIYKVIWREGGREGGREGERAQINSQSIGYGQVVNFDIIFTSTGY